MTADDRFKPPGAVVADIEVEPGDARAAVIVIAVAGLLQLAWVAFGARGYLELVGAGALRPIGLLFAVGGLGYLYFGIARLVLRATVRARHFVFAAVGLSLCVVSWWSGRELYLAMPFLLGIALAAAGWRIVQVRRGAVAPSESP